MDHSTSRRRFLANMAAAGALVPLMRMGTAGAADLPHLSPSDAAAKTLHYYEDASSIDPSKEPMFKKGSHCAVCVLFQGGSADWGPCGVFPGKAVHRKGWCQSFAPKG